MATPAAAVVGALDVNVEGAAGTSAAELPCEARTAGSADETRLETGGVVADASPALLQGAAPEAGGGPLGSPPAAAAVEVGGSPLGSPPAAAVVEAGGGPLRPWRRGVALWVHPPLLLPGMRGAIRWICPPP